MNVGDLVSRISEPSRNLLLAERDLWTTAPLWSRRRIIEIANEIGIIIDMTIDTLPELAIVLWPGDKLEHLYTDELEFIDHDKEKL